MQRPTTRKLFIENSRTAHQGFICLPEDARMKSSIFLLLAAAITSCAGDIPDLTHATVTIPYTELRALWEAGQRRPEAAKEVDAAPVAFLVHRADVRLQLGENASVIDAEFEVETLDKKWQTIPLLGGDARLDKADAGERSVIWNDGYELLASATGNAPVTLHLAARGARQLTVPMKLKLGSASVKRLTISGIPAGLEARVNGQPAVATKDGIAIFHLPGEAGETSIELSAPVIEEAPKPATPSHWRTQSQVLARFAGGRLRFLSRVFAHTDDGSGLEMTLAMPASVSAMVVTGEDLADTEQSRADDGRRLTRIRWKTRDVLDREVSIAYAAPQPPLAEQWILLAPATPDAGDARHLYAIVPADGLDLKGDGLRTAVESRRLPEWMREEIGGAAFITAEAASPLTLQTHWLPSIATAEAIVSEATAQLRVVPDGATQTAVSYAIKHQAPLAWRLELPESVEILSCNVGGVAVQPIQRDNGVIEFALAAPEKGLTNVALVYTAKVKALDPVSGDIALELPRTPLFTERIDWSIGIPAQFEVTAFEGSGFVAGPAAEDRTLALRKDFCRAERPAVALFYKRRNLEK